MYSVRVVPLVLLGLPLSLVFEFILLIPNFTYLSFNAQIVTKTLSFEYIILSEIYAFRYYANNDDKRIYK